MIGGPLDTPRWPMAQERIKAFKDRFKVDAGPYGILMYDMVTFYFDALGAVKDPTDHKAIANTMGKLQKKTAAGMVAFDPDTHLAIQSADYIPVSFYQIWDGKGQLISPAKYAVSEFATPPWQSK